MDEVITRFDKVLVYLKNDKEKFHNPFSVLSALQIDDSEIGSILKTLGDNQLIEFNAHHYKPSDIRVTAKGIELIEGLGFTSAYGLNPDLKKNIVMMVEGDNDKAKERLEIKQMQLTINSLEMQLKDYPKIRREAHAAILFAAFSALATLAQLLL